MFSLLSSAEETKNQNLMFGVLSSAGNAPWNITRCQICKRMLSKEQVNNLGFDLYGSDVESFVWTDTPDVLVSEGFAEKLIASGMRGIAFKEIEIITWLRSDGETTKPFPIGVLPHLRQLVVTGKGGSILTKNHAEIVSHCSACSTIVYKLCGKGIKIDENEWDGSDIFAMEELPGINLVTEKFSQWLKSNGITNYKLTPTEEFVLDDCSFTKLANEQAL